MSEILQEPSLEPPRELWFNSNPIYISFTAIIVAYAFSGFYFHRLNEAMGDLLTPIVELLGDIGIKIAPILIGPLDANFLKNLSGLSFIGACTYNIIALVYMLKNKRSAALGCIDAHAALMKRKQWGAKKAWIVLHLNIYAGFTAISIFLTSTLLNSIFHWQVFLVDHSDVLKTTLVSLYFCFAGMMSINVYSIIIQYLIFDIRYFLDHKPKP